MRRLRRFLGLSSADRLLLVEMILLLGVIRLALWALPFRVVRRLLTRLSESPPRPGTRAMDRATVARLVWAVNVAGRRTLGDSPCLTEALAIHLVLARRGHPARLRIGVAKDGTGRLQAHAWVESGGAVVIGGPASLVERFSPLSNLDRAPR